MTENLQTLLVLAGNDMTNLDMESELLLPTVSSKMESTLQ